MRKHLIWMLALAVAVSVASVAWATDSTGLNYSSLKMKVSPSKLSKTKYKPAKLSVETSTLSNVNGGTPTKPGTSPSPTTKVLLKFDKDLKFTTKGLATCDINQIQGQPTSVAKSVCGKAQVGSGSATVCIAGGNAGVNCTAPGTTFAAVVTAFNGKPAGGKPTILLHSAIAALNQAPVLTGTLDPKKNTLTVPIPAQTYNLATITDFQTTVKKSYKSKGKTLNYVTARCSHKKLTLNGTFTYKADPTDKVSTTAPCKGS